MTTAALAVIGGDELETIQRTGRLLAASGYFDAKGDATTQMAQMAAKIMAGRELGFGPFASVNGIHIIKGKPSVSANLMATAVKNSARYDYRVKQLSDEGCTVEFFEVTNGTRESIGISTFTKADAAKAGTENMSKFARNMMFARAMSNGVKWYCPDVFSGNAIYVPEELGASIDGDGNVVEGTMRVVDQTTGEILDRPAQPADVDMGMGNGTSPHKYADLIDRLGGSCATLATKMREVHANSDGPASAAQYQYLSGVIDAIVDKKGAHNAILEVVVGRPVTGENPCGKGLASKLLDYLVATKKVDDGEVANPNYREDVANCVKTIWGLVLEIDGQLRLIEA